MSTYCSRPRHKSGARVTALRSGSDLPVLVEGFSIVAVASVFVHITFWTVLRNRDVCQSEKDYAVGSCGGNTELTWKGSWR